VRRLTQLVVAAVAAIAVVSVALGTGFVRVPGTPTASPVAVATPSPAAVSTPSPAPTATPAPSAPTPSPFVPTGIDVPGIAVRLQAALDAGRTSIAAPGIQASVIFADGRQWTGVSGVADLATKRPLSADTPFAIASVSKTFVAADVLMLVAAGRLSLDESVARRLPTTLVAGKAIDPAITIRMLLDHTSGLGDYLVSPKLDIALQADPLAVWTPQQALAYAGKLAGKPGAGYHYANTNYVLLGLIVEGVTGRSLAAELRARFFDPLRLSTASYQGVEAPKGELPTTYRYSSIRLSAKPVDTTDGTDIRPFTSLTTATGAAGSIAASSRDLARWARALYGGYVLPADLLGLMVTDALATEKLDPPYPYGLGVQVFTIDGRVSYGHSGRLVGARTVVRWFPDSRVAIAITTNQSRFDTTPILRALLDIAAPREAHGGATAD
jgi:D-alanyl-D-alanine carboxypeptidase